MYEAARDRLGAGPHASRSATGSTSTSRARAAPGWTRRSCSPARRRASEADAADPRPTHVADSLGGARAGGVASSARMDRPGLPDRQPARRRRPRRAAAARASRPRCARTGCAFRVERTTSMEHARELAREARDGGRDRRRRWAATGSPARSRASCATATACSPCSPAGAGTTSRASSASPFDPVGGRATLLAAGSERRIDLAEAGGRVYLGILSAGLRLRRAADRQLERGCQLGTLVYAYGALRALRALEAGRTGTVTVDGERARVHRVLRGGGELRRVRRRHVPRAGRRARRRPARRRADRRASPSARYLRGLPRVFKGTHVDEPGDHAPARPRGHVPAPTGRSPPTRTATRSPSCPLTVRVAARRAAGGGAAMMRLAAGRGRRARRSARSRAPPAAAAARRCPARCSRASSRTRSAGSRARLERGSVVISATNGKTTTAAMVASILERTGARLVHNRAGREHGGRRRQRAGRRRRAAAAAR